MRMIFQERPTLPGLMVEVLEDTAFGKTVGMRVLGYRSHVVRRAHWRQLVPFRQATRVAQLTPGTRVFVPLGGWCPGTVLGRAAGQSTRRDVRTSRTKIHMLVDFGMGDVRDVPWSELLIITEEPRG